jgi:hypothetical protein
MSPTQKARRWTQNNPQLATSLLTFIFFAGVAAASGDLANLDGVDTYGGTESQGGP